MKRFTAHIEIIGINPFVQLPVEWSERLVFMDMFEVNGVV
jgi:hypothetical protein